MASLAHFTALGGQPGDTYSVYKIAANGVLADGDYVWEIVTPGATKTYDAALLPAQATTKVYAASLLPAQAGRLSGSIVSTLAAGVTGVSYADLHGSTTHPNGNYLQRNGSYVPIHLEPGNVLSLGQPTIGVPTVTAQVGDILTIQWPVRMNPGGRAAVSLTVDVFDALDTAFATPLAAQQIITTGIGLNALVNVSFANLDGMNGSTPRSFVIRAVAA